MNIIYKNVCRTIDRKKRYWLVKINKQINKQQLDPKVKINKFSSERFRETLHLRSFNAYE